MSVSASVERTTVVQGAQERPAQEPHPSPRQDFSAVMHDLRRGTPARDAVPRGGGKQKLGRFPVNADSWKGTSPPGEPGAALTKLAGQVRQRGEAWAQPELAHDAQRCRDERGEQFVLEPGAAQGVGDPLARALAIVPTLSPAEQGACHASAIAPTPEWTRLLRRFAWGESRGRAVAQLEFGSGDLEGATLTIESGASGVSLVLQLPVGSGAADWAERFSERLARRGLQVVDVRVE